MKRKEILDRYLKLSNEEQEDYLFYDVELYHKRFNRYCCNNKGCDFKTVRKQNEDMINSFNLDYDKIYVLAWKGNLDIITIKDGYSNHYDFNNGLGTVDIMEILTSDDIDIIELYNDYQHFKNNNYHNESYKIIDNFGKKTLICFLDDMIKKYKFQFDIDRIVDYKGEDFTLWLRSQKLKRVI